MDSTATNVLELALFIIMTGMGLSLTINDFKRVLESPKAIFIGFFNQIILLPIIAFGLINFFDVTPTLAMGVLILSACPGGPTSNLLTHLAKADTALSVSLTAINSLITIITIPLIINFGLDHFADVTNPINAPVGKIARSLIVVIAVPLAIGMAIKKYLPNAAQKMDKPVRIASVSLLFIIIVGLVIKERATIVEHVSNSILIVLTLNIITMVVGYISAKIASLSPKQALTIALESGNQNGTLAIHVAVISLAEPQFAIAGAVYSLIMYFTAAIPIWWGNKQFK